MKVLFFFVALILSNIAFAQDPNFIEDFSISFASTQLKLTYIEEGTPSPVEGYLLSISDLALIKLIVDDSKASCSSIVQEIKNECSKDISDCQRSATNRFDSLIKEKEILVLKNTVFQTKIKDQRNSFIFYTTLSVAASIVLTALVINIGS